MLMLMFSSLIINITYFKIGCGKTFTMLGDPNSEQFKGIIPRTFSHIVNVVQASTDK